MIRLSVRRITLVLAIVSACFTVLGVVTQVLSPGVSDEYTWTHMFDLDAEANLPTFYQTGLLLVSAALLWLIGASRPPGDRTSRDWTFLAWVFVYLAADENATIHETLGFWIAEHFDPSMDVYAWLIPGIAFVVFMAFRTRSFLRQMSTATRVGFLVAAVVYVGGAAGVEMIEAFINKLWGTLPFSLVAAFEETLEMAGLVIFIRTLLVHMKGLTPPPTIVVDP